MTDQRADTQAHARIEYVDVAKGIAMLCIVAGHVGYWLPGGANAVVPAVFQFHVPLFFIISGYFISAKKPAAQFARQRARRLLAPYALTCAVLVVMVALFTLATGHSKPPTQFSDVADVLVAGLLGYGGAPQAGAPYIGAIWFLQALFVASIEVRLLMRFERVAPVAVMLLMIVACLTKPLCWLPFNIQPGLLGGFFVYVGHAFRRLNLFSRTFTRAQLALAFCVTLAIFLICYRFAVCVDVCGANPGRLWLGIPVAVSSSIMVIIVSRFIALHLGPLRRFFEFYGANSMQVLCVHLVLITCGIGSITFGGLLPHEPWRFIASFALQLAATAAFAALSKRIPGLRTVFGA